MMVCSLQSPLAPRPMSGYVAGGMGKGLAQHGCGVKGLRRPGRKADESFRPDLDPDCHYKVFFCAALICAKKVTFFFFK